MGDNFDPYRPRYVGIDEAVERVGQGWLAQFRGSMGVGSIGALIRLAAGGGPHTHSGIFERTTSGGVNILELREFRGGRSLPLLAHYRESPGAIDVFSPNAGGRWPEWDADGAVRVMRELVTCGYGYRGILRVALRHLPFLWRLYKIDTSDVCVDQRDAGIRPFCSHAVALAAQVGGNVDPVPRLPDYLVEPSHLTRSLFYRYEFSIAPPPDLEIVPLGQWANVSRI
jgi:hypothetical protein